MFDECAIWIFDMRYEYLTQNKQKHFFTHFKFGKNGKVSHLTSKSHGMFSWMGFEHDLWTTMCLCVQLNRKKKKRKTKVCYNTTMNIKEIMVIVVVIIIALVLATGNTYKRMNEKGHKKIYKELDPKTCTIKQKLLLFFINCLSKWYAKLKMLAVQK